ncbi:MAG: hypothetical protein ACJ8CB_23870 [Ktedonobacteraceae bacterium]
MILNLLLILMHKLSFVKRFAILDNRFFFAYTGKKTYELPKIGALNFVLFDALGGGVTRSLALDRHGKSLSSALLEMEIKEDFTIRDFRMKKEEYDMTEWLEGEVK